MASVGRGLRVAVVRLVATLLVFRVAERVSVTVESLAADPMTTECTCGPAYAVAAWL